MGLFGGGPKTPWSGDNKPDDPNDSHGPRVPWSRPSDNDPNDSHGPRVPWARSGSGSSGGGFLSNILSKIFGRK